MGRVAQQAIPLHRGLAHQAKFVCLKIFDAAMDEARWRSTGTAANVAPVNQQTIDTLQAEVAKSPTPIDASTDDQNRIVGLLGLGMTN